MVQIKYALFDLDGVLADSMYYWRRSVLEYAENTLQGGADAISPELRERLCTISTYSGIRLLHEAKEIPSLTGLTVDAVFEQMLRHYEKDIRPKACSQALLQLMAANGVTMALTTATPRRLAETFLRKWGMLDYFRVIVTQEDYPAGKKSPAFFYGTLERLGATAAETVLFEDSLYSARTAKSIGIRVIAVEDAYETEPAALRALADEYICLGETRKE